MACDPLGQAGTSSPWRLASKGEAVALEVFWQASPCPSGSPLLEASTTQAETMGGPTHMPSSSHQALEVLGESPRAWLEILAALAGPNTSLGGVRPIPGGSPALDSTASTCWLFYLSSHAPPPMLAYSPPLCPTHLKIPSCLAYTALIRTLGSQVECQTSRVFPFLEKIPLRELF